jgi:hypothetical protein
MRPSGPVTPRGGCESVAPYGAPKCPSSRSSALRGGDHPTSRTMHGECRAIVALFGWSPTRPPPPSSFLRVRPGGRGNGRSPGTRPRRRAPHNVHGPNPDRPSRLLPRLTSVLDLRASALGSRLDRSRLLRQARQRHTHKGPRMTDEALPTDWGTWGRAGHAPLADQQSARVRHDEREAS